MKIYKIIKATKYIFIHINNVNVKINIDALKLNYADKIKYSDIFYIKCKNITDIYNFNANKIQIPEGYILSKNLNDGIYIFKNPDNYINIIIKKDWCLIKDYFVKNLSEREKELLEFEHNLTLFEKDYNEYIQKGYEKLSILEIIKFIKPININKKKLKETLYDLGLPFLILSVLLTLSAYGAKNFYQKKLNTTYQHLDRLKKKSFILTKEIDKIKKIDTIYKNIIDKTKINRINIINKIAASLTKNARISYIRIDDRNILFTIDTNNSTKLLEKLNNIKEIKNLKLTSSVSINKNIKRYRFKGEIFW